MSHAHTKNLILEIETFLKDNKVSSQESNSDVVHLLSLTNKLIEDEYKLYVDIDNKTIEERWEKTLQLTNKVRLELFEHIKEYGNTFNYSIDEKKENFFELKINDALTLTEKTIEDLESNFRTTSNIRDYISSQTREDLKLIKWALKIFVEIPNFHEIVALLIINTINFKNYQTFLNHKNSIAKTMDKIIKMTKMYFNESN